MTLDARITALAQAVGADIKALSLGLPPGTSPTVVAKFVIVGALRVQAMTPRWYPERNVTLTQVYFSLGTAPAAEVVLDVRLNGTSLFPGARPTAAVGAQLSTSVTLSQALSPTDYLTVAVLSASGADATLCLVYH